VNCNSFQGTDRVRREIDSVSDASVQGAPRRREWLDVQAKLLSSSVRGNRVLR
jgi:hypothetical protein